MNGEAQTDPDAPIPTKDGLILPPRRDDEDKRTEQVRGCCFRIRHRAMAVRRGAAFPGPSAAQEKRRDEARKKREEELIRKAAEKSYRDRVREYNVHLASLSEYHGTCRRRQLEMARFLQRSQSSLWSPNYRHPEGLGRHSEVKKSSTARS